MAPDSIVNQTEGGILQSLSWTLYEAVHFNDTRILSADWSAYPILRFSAVPDSVAVHVVTIRVRPISAWRKPRRGRRPARSPMRSGTQRENASTTFPIARTREGCAGV
nr:hypothetical protein [Mesorhizobium sp. B2-4-13]